MDQQTAGSERQMIDPEIFNRHFRTLCSRWFDPSKSGRFEPLRDGYYDAIGNMSEEGFIGACAVAFKHADKLPSPVELLKMSPRNAPTYKAITGGP